MSMDNLTRCVFAAEAAGLSYGQYMAKRPVLSLQKREAEEDARKCVICGKYLGPEYRMGSKYCSKLCASRANALRNRDKFRKQSGVTSETEVICRGCGKPFLIGSGHASRKYCSPECRERSYFTSRVKSED